jgi:hypothetical protein
VAEGDAGDVAGAELEAVLGDGGAAQVATEALERVAVVGVDGDRGVQIEAFDVSMQGAVARLGARNERVAEARNEAASLRAEGADTADGGLLQGGERDLGCVQGGGRRRAATLAAQRFGWARRYSWATQASMRAARGCARLAGT